MDLAKDIQRLKFQYQLVRSNTERNSFRLTLPQLPLPDLDGPDILTSSLQCPICPHYSPPKIKSNSKKKRSQRPFKQSSPKGRRNKAQPIQNFRENQPSWLRKLKERSIDQLYAQSCRQVQAQAKTERPQSQLTSSRLGNNFTLPRNQSYTSLASPLLSPRTTANQAYLNSSQANSIRMSPKAGQLMTSFPSEDVQMLVFPQVISEESQKNNSNILIKQNRETITAVPPLRFGFSSSNFNSQTQRLQIPIQYREVQKSDRFVRKSKETDSEDGQKIKESLQYYKKILKEIKQLHTSINQPKQQKAAEPQQPSLQQNHFINDLRQENAVLKNKCEKLEDEMAIISYQKRQQIQRQQAAQRQTSCHKQAQEQHMVKNQHIDFQIRDLIEQYEKRINILQNQKTSVQDQLKKTGQKNTELTEQFQKTAFKLAILEEEREQVLLQQHQLLQNKDSQQLLLRQTEQLRQKYQEQKQLNLKESQKNMELTLLVNQYSAQIAQLKQKVQFNAQELNSFRKQIQNSEQQYLQVHSQLLQARAQEQRAMVRVSGLIAQIEMLKRCRESLQRQCQQLKTDLQREGMKLIELQFSADQKTNQLQQLKKENAQLKEQCLQAGQLQKAQALEFQHRIQLSQQLFTQTGQRQKLAGYREKELVSQIEALNQQLQTKNSQHEEEITHLYDKLNHLKSLNCQLSKDKDYIQEQAKQDSIRQKLLQLQNKGLKANIKLLEQQGQSSRQQLSQLKLQAQNKGQQLDKMRLGLQLLTSQKLKLQEEYQRAEEQSEKMGQAWRLAELKCIEQEHNLNKQISALKYKQILLEKKVDEKELELYEQQTKLYRLNQELSELEEKQDQLLQKAVNNTPNPNESRLNYYNQELVKRSQVINDNLRRECDLRKEAQARLKRSLQEKQDLQIKLLQLQNKSKYNQLCQDQLRNQNEELKKGKQHLQNDCELNKAMLRQLKNKLLMQESQNTQYLQLLKNQFQSKLHEEKKAQEAQRRKMDQERQKLQLQFQKESDNQFKQFVMKLQRQKQLAEKQKRLQQRDLQDRQDQIDNLKRQFKEKLEELLSLGKQNQELKDQLRRNNEIYLDNALQNNELSHSKIKEANQVIASLKLALHSAQDKLTQREHDSQERATIQQKLKEQLQSVREQCLKCKVELQAASLDNIQLIVKVQNLQTVCNSNHINSICKSSLDEKQISYFNLENRQLRASLDDTSKLKERLLKQLNSNRAQLFQAQMRISRLQTQLQSQQGQNEALRKREQSLLREKSQLLQTFKEQI